MNKKTILVVGGAGYIGSHVNKMLNRAGYNTIILDNLSRGNAKAIMQGTFVEGDMADESLLDRIFNQYPIEAVMHFAAFTDVGESMVEPLKYYRNNVANTLCLLDAMRRHQVRTFIFSSTAAIFGVPQQDSINEDHDCNPINPYGESKLTLEKILHDLNRANILRSCCLRYFNAAGGDPEGEIKYYQRKESNLIPKILQSLLKDDGVVTIFGTDYPTIDGTCIRDYIHIEDLGQAHILAMEQLLKGASSNCYNLGNGKGFSVREVITAAEKVTGKQIRVVEGPRRPGDPAILVSNAYKAEKELGWNPKYSSLESMIDHAWKAMKG